MTQTAVKTAKQSGVVADSVAASPQADVAEIRRALDLLAVPGGVVEVRALTCSRQGQAAHRGRLLHRLGPGRTSSGGPRRPQGRGGVPGLERIEPALFARSPNQTTEHLDPTTSDGDILRRWWLPLDFDPTRPAGISATEDEHCAAEDAARACWAWLSSLGWPAPFQADSGNGAHLGYRIDLAADDGRLVQRVLEAIADKLDGAAVKVDRKVFNPARIWKLYGTVARKGHDMPDRPHRLARLVEVPEPVEAVPVELLQALAGTVAKPEPSRPSTTGNGFTSRLDVARWLAARGVTFKTKDRPDSRGRAVYLLGQCPFDSGHGGHGETAIYQALDGQLGADCKHNSCPGRDWQEFKAAIGPPEPEHYDPPLPDHRHNGEPAGARQEPERKPRGPRFPLVTCAALDSKDYTPTPIITEALFADSPHFIGGLFKACKTLTGVAAAIAIATGRPFLNLFTIAKLLRVLYFTGEGGPPVAQDYARRVAASYGVPLSQVENLSFCFTLPRLENLSDLDDFARVLDDTAPGVVFLDNTTLCMPGDRAGVVMAMGQIFANVIRLCSERGVTPVFLHHFKRTRADQCAPGELLDLTQAGAAEIAGQWWLLTRRQPYDPDQAGEHRLWLSIGGRVGHSSLHALDIHEGRRSDPGGRRWEVEVYQASEAREAARQAQQAMKQAARQAKQEANLETDRREIIGILAKRKALETKTAIRERASCGHGRRFDTAFASLVADGTIQQAKTEKDNKQTYPGWKLKNDPEE